MSESGTWKPKWLIGGPLYEGTNQGQKYTVRTGTHTEEERGVSGMFIRFLLWIRHHRSFIYVVVLFFCQSFQIHAINPLLARFCFPKLCMAAMELNPALSPRPALSFCFISLLFCHVLRLFTICGDVCCSFFIEFYFFIIYLFMAVLGLCCCTGFSLVAATL